MGSLSPLGILMVLLQTALSLTSETGSPQILSFTYEEWDPGDNQWISTTDIERGNDIRLICTIDSPSSEKFRIEKLELDGTIEVGSLTYPNTRQVTHEFKTLECDKFGDYVCDDGLGSNKTLQIGIFNCEPRVCNEEDASTITTSVALSETVTFDVCVRAYPEIGVDVVATSSIPKRPTDTDVKDPNIRSIPTTTEELDQPNVWKYDVEPDPNLFGTYTVRISKPSISRDDYGEHKFAIFTTHEGSRKQLNYTVVLQPSETGPPDCPTDLEVSDQKSDSLTLSWQPGFDGGSAQFFLVYILRDDGWSLTSTPTQGNAAHISGLEENTQYAFKVIPHNKFSQEPSEHRCQNTVEVVTERLSKANDNKTNNEEIIIAVCIVVGLLIVAVTGFVALRYNKRKYRMSSRNGHLGSCSEGGSLENGLMIPAKMGDHGDNQQFR